MKPKRLKAYWSACSGCGRELSERKRKPCPTCGSMARTHARQVHEMLGTRDRA